MNRKGVKRKRLKRITALLLCMVLLVTSIPAMAFAEGMSMEEAEAETEVTENAAEETEPVEITERREETVKHFRNADGSFTAVNYMTPVHYKEDGDKKWTEINNTLYSVQTGAEGESVTKYIPQSSPVDVQITDTADSSTLVSLQGEKHRITWSYENLKNIKAEKKAKKEKTEKTKEKKDKTKEYFSEEMTENLTDGLVYTDVAESADLEILLDGPNLKENLILKDKHARTQYVIRYDITGLLAEEEDDHTILLKDGDETVFTIHAPYMSDAAGAVSDGVNLHIFSQEDGILQVVLTADKDWVKAKERVYPVVVDPYVTELSKKTNYDATAFEVIQGSDYPYGTLAAGNDGDYATGDGKAYLKFDLPALKAGDMVTSGRLALHQFPNAYGYDNSGAERLQVNIYQVTESWSASDIINQSYSSAPTHSSTVMDYVKVSAPGSSPVQKTFDITRAMKAWYADKSANKGVCIKADGTSPGAMARFIATDSPEFTGYYHPYIIVQYLNNKGLENRWTYHEQSLGESGSGYVNDYTGNLVFSVPLAATGGELMPASVSLVYNGYQKGKSVDQITTCGEGWRLNIQQRVMKLEADNTGYGASVNELYDKLYAAGYRYIYEDSDGTDHYFHAKEGSSTKFVDEEGLNLELSAVSGSDDSLEVTQISAKDGSRLTFTGRGYLRAAYDSDGNKYKLYYSTSTAGAVTALEDGGGRGIGLTRDSSGRLQKVTDPSGRIWTLAYFEGGNLSSVAYPDGTAVQFAYSSNRLHRVLGRDGVRIRYSYPADSENTDDSELNRVKTVEEFGKGAGSGCDTAYLGQSTGISYGRNRTTFTDGDGFKEYYTFDNYGRTVSVSDSEGGYRSFSYVNPTALENPSDVSKKAHLLKSTGTASRYVENLLEDHSYEAETAQAHKLYSAAVTTSAHYLGKKSVRLDTAGDYAAQRYDASSGEYTFSARVKTDDGSVHPKLRVTFYDAAGNNFTYVETPVRKTTMNWARMHLSFSVPAGTSYFYVSCRKEGTGNAYFDCLQLEEGLVMNAYNLLENSGFEKSITDTWTGYNTGSADKRKTDDGNYYYLTGEGEKAKRLHQRVYINRPAGNLFFSVRGLGKASSIPFSNSDRRFGLCIHTAFTDGTTSNQYVLFNPDFTGSQNAAGTCGYGDSTKTVEYIDVRLVYNYNENSARFDKIQVNIDESGTSYSYDAEGNLISSSDNAGRKQTFTYSSAGEVLRAVSPDNKEYTYTYASGNKHQLKTAVSESSDIQFSFGHDTKGNNTQTRVQGLDSEGNRTGRYLLTGINYTEDQNHVSGSYNSRGYGNTYTWNAEKDLLQTETEPGGHVTTYTYASNDDYLTGVSKGSTQVSYDYTTANLLAKITSPNTVYHFDYDIFGNVLKTRIGENITLADNTYAAKNGNLQQTVYGNGFTTAYTYDDYDRVNGISHNGSTKYTWTYNGEGQPGRHEDKVSGKIYQYTYDLAGRLQRSDISDGSYVRMKYNDIDLPTGMYYSVKGDSSQDMTYSYSSRDNLPETAAFESSHSVTNSYDSLGRLEGKTYASTGSGAADTNVSYGYLDFADSDRTTDVLNCVDYTFNTGGLALGDRFYRYTTRGYLSHEYLGTDSSGEISDRYGYDDKGQLVRHYDRTENKTFVYEYDSAGNILSKKTYPYVESQDALNAIIANPQSTVTYTYDSGAWGDVLKSYDGKSVTSDAIGNITGFDGQTFTWEGRQLASYKKNGVTTSYKYNADGIRTEKKSGNTVTEYLLNGSQILAMVTKTGDAVTDTAYFYYDSEGRRIGMYHGNRYMYYVYNGQGDVTALADAESGQIISAYSYDAWGNCTVENAEGISEGTFNPFRYRGYYWDAESGLYYLNSRYYSPELCRFISADSQINGDIVGINLFAYCSNNPINCIDADGYALDFLLDVASTAYSLWQVAKNPRNLSNWAALAVDVVCLAVPFATGGGTIVRGAAKYGDDVYDAVRTGKTLDRVSDGADAGKYGSYVIKYSDGTTYVGKGSIERAFVSANERGKNQKVASLTWESAKDEQQAFIDEYIKMCQYGGPNNRAVGNTNSHNKIWSPGRKLYYQKNGNYYHDGVRLW